MSYKDTAQRFCWGKTHYFDNSTLRFFQSRVLYAEVRDGTLYAIESLPVSWQGPRKRHAVMVDSDGTVTRGPFRRSTREAMRDFHSEDMKP